MRSNTIIWLALVVLSVIGFSAGGKALASLVLAAAALKSLLVGWQFMDLRSAAPVWRITFPALLVPFLVVIYLLVAGG